MREACETCRFFIDGNSAWDHSGECRRYPPKTGSHPRGGVDAEFPKTLRRSWCGEHRLAEVAA